MELPSAHCLSFYSDEPASGSSLTLALSCAYKASGLAGSLKAARTQARIARENVNSARVKLASLKELDANLVEIKDLPEMALWTEAAALISKRPEAFASFELPFIESSSLPDVTGTYLLKNSGKKWSANLTGGTGLDSKSLKTSINYNTKNSQAASAEITVNGSVSVSSDKSVATVTFDSPSSLGLREKEVSAGTSIKLWFEQDPYREPRGCKSSVCSSVYKNFAVVSSAPKESKPPFAVTFETKSIVMGDNSEGTLVFSNSVEKNKDGSLKADRVYVTIVDAQIKSVTSKDKDRKEADHGNFEGRVRVNPNTRTVVRLMGVHKNSLVTVSASAVKIINGDESVVSKQDPEAFTIVQPKANPKSTFDSSSSVVDAQTTLIELGYLWRRYRY